MNVTCSCRLLYLNLIRPLRNVHVTSHAKTYTNGYPFERRFAVHLPFIRRSKKFAYVRTACVIRSKKICIRSHGQGYPFKKNLHPFAWSGLSVHKKIASVRMGRVIRSKKFASVRTACVIRSKNLHPFARLMTVIRPKKLASVRTAGVIRPKKIASVRSC